MDNKIPPLDPALVKALDARFPERTPEPEWPDREIWMRAGERRLIRFLQHTLAEQSENVLTTPNPQR